jgi:chitinase
MLDQTMIIYGSPMADSNLHNHRRAPLIALGGANGALEGNLHLKAPDGTPMANPMLTMLHGLGLDDLDGFGDSTGDFALSMPTLSTQS